MTMPQRNGHDELKPQTVQGLQGPHVLPSLGQGPTGYVRPAANVVSVAFEVTREAVEPAAWLRAAPMAVTDPTLVGYGNAQLPILPAPLKLRHGPLLVSVERWSDGNVVARLPSARLYGEGRTESEALSELAEDIAHVVRDLTEGQHAVARLGGAVLDTWRALSAMIDAPGLERPRE